jgi:hypothetical protein
MYVAKEMSLHGTVSLGDAGRPDTGVGVVMSAVSQRLFSRQLGLNKTPNIDTASRRPLRSDLSSLSPVLEL